MTENKKEQLLKEIAKELRKKHELALFNECLEIGSRIYEMTKEE